MTGFVLELLARGGKDPVGVEDLNELIKGLQALAVEKQRLADANRNKIGAKQKALAAKKKEHKAKSAQHKEVFGADFDEDDPDMDQYYAMEDVRGARRPGYRAGVWGLVRARFFLVRSLTRGAFPRPRDAAPSTLPSHGGLWPTAFPPSLPLTPQEFM